MEQASESRRVVDYKGTDLSVGQRVTYYDEKERRFFTAVVKMVGQKQAVLGTVDEQEEDVEFDLIEGEAVWPDGPRGREVLRFPALSVLPQASE